MKILLKLCGFIISINILLINFDSVIKYLNSCCPKLVFLLRTQKRIFLNFIFRQ